MPMKAYSTPFSEKLRRIDPVVLICALILSSVSCPETSILDGLASAVMVGVRSSVTTTESSRRNLPKDSRKRPRGGVRYP